MILIFKNINGYRKFFEKLGRRIDSNIEYKIFKNYEKNKILITAEHAFTERIRTPQYGKHAYIGLGDKNTDILAKIAAYSLQSAYMVPWISRYKVDFARNPQLIGKDNRLLVKVYRSTIPIKKYTKVHNDKKYLPFLMRYLYIIEKLKPNFILSYHGMHSRHPTDISLGAGPDYKYLGGRDQAKRFVSYLRHRINTELKEMGFKKPLNIRLSTLFLGTKNYMLNSFTKKGIRG